MHCNALRWTVLHCTALSCTALICTALCTGIHCTALHCTELLKTKKISDSIWHYVLKMVFPVSLFTTLSNLDGGHLFAMFYKSWFRSKQSYFNSCEKGLIWRNVLTSLMWILGELAVGWSLAVGVSNRWQVTCNIWHMKSDMWLMTQYIYFFFLFKNILICFVSESVL